MGELQATIELAVHLHKFYNVDLFQRGYYQIRVFLRSTPKLPTKIELSLPKTSSEWKGGGGLVFPPCVVNGAAVSKTFQILYRNEEVQLDDSAHFKLHLIVDSHKIADSLDRSDLQLLVELWFTESTFGPDHHNAIQCVSARTLHLHFSPTRGLHYHLPVLFDYFHLSAITMTIHAVLVSLHQPYINGGKTTKSWSPKLSSRLQQSNMENVFFGNFNNTIRCGGGGNSTTSWRLAQARRMHRTICTLLLAANTALAAQLETLMSILPPWASSGAGEGSSSGQSASGHPGAGPTNSVSAPSTPQPTRLKIDNLSDVAKECYYAIIGAQNQNQVERRQSEKPRLSRIQTVDCEEDFLVSANSDIAHLCAENILLWQHFLTVVSGSEPIRQHLARNHHIQRVKRFAEAFFVIDNPRPSATGCYDSNYQNYAMISEAVRRSRYFALLPPLPVECVEVDGDASTLPVVFEDQYQHVAEFARRRSIANRKSDNYLSSADIEIAMDQLDSNEGKREVLYPPDVTKPEPSFVSNGIKAKSENTPVFQLNNKTPAKQRESKASSSNLETKSLSNAALDFKIFNDIDSKSIIFTEGLITKYGTHPLKSQSHIKSNLVSMTSTRDLKKAVSVNSTVTKARGKARPGEGRSRSSDSRVSLSHSGNGSSRHTLGSESDGEERTQGPRKSRASITKGSREKQEVVNKESRPPIPPRTDKMPKDFKPPIPPKLHKLPIPRNSLKEKLKNNLKLELRLPSSQGNTYKRAKFKVKLLQRAQQLRGNATGKNKKIKFQSNADSIVLLKYRRLEPSLSMPYNLGANTPGACSTGSADQPMRHSQSTLSMPSFLLEMANTASPGFAESLPDLLASDTESSSESQITHTHPPRSRVERKPPILSNVEVGLASASDDTLIEVGKTKGQVSQLTKPKVSSPTKKPIDFIRPTHVVPESSSNSDITSEQSGWVSNSSRQSSGSSSCHVSPELDIKPFPIPNMLSAASTYKTNGNYSSGGKLPKNSFASEPNSTPKTKSNACTKSTPIIRKTKLSESKLQGQKTNGKENGVRSASNDHLQILRKKSPNRKEVKKSQSLQKVDNTPKQSVPIYDQVPLLPPPPKEFQDPNPTQGLKQPLKVGSFGTTGRLPREDRFSRKLVNNNNKDRPRSESPRTDTTRPSNEEPKKMEKATKTRLWAAGSRFSADLDLQEAVINQESLSEVFADAQISSTSQVRDKFNSLPSMRRKHQAVNLIRKPEKAKTLVKKIPGTPDHLSDPTPPTFGRTVQGVVTDRTRTQSAPPPNIDKGEGAKDPSTAKGVKFQRHSEPIPSKSDPFSHLAENKCSLLELFLEQQGASVWAQREAQRELLKEAQRVSKLNPMTEAPKAKNGRTREGMKPAREKSRSQPDLNDVLESLSGIPPPPKPPSPSRTEPKCTCPSELRKERIRTEEPPPDLLPQKLSPPVPDNLAFLKSKEEFKQQINFQGLLYSDFSGLASTPPYFHVSDDCRILSPDGLHLIVCVHGLDGNSADLRLIKTYLEIGLPGANLDFLMSEQNQGDTFSNFETLTDRLVTEILYHLEFFNLNPKRISFVGHSLGNIIIRGAVSHPQMKPFLPKLHTFLSLSGPHLGTLYNNSGLVNMGMWFMQKWKKSGSLLQLALKDRVDIRQTFLYKLSQRSQLHNFKNVILCGSSQDRYVPLHSARIELCRQAVRDNSVIGAAYREMVSNLLQPIICSPSVTLVRFDIHHALPSTANSLIGRAAHIAVLDSELFIEKFLLVTGLKYFK